MTLRHLKIFVTVCEYSSITKAAESLYIAQPAVSMAIKELEEYYNVKLFDRISRRLYITDAGRNLLDYALHIVELFNETENILRNPDVVRKLRIGSSITIGTCYMPRFIKLFSESHPLIKTTVFINSSETVEEMVEKNQLDIAFIEGVAHTDSLVCTHFAADRLVMICAGNAEIDGESIFEQPFLLREKGSGTRELFDNVTAANGYSIEPVWESTSTQALINAVSAGIGISVLPYRLIKDYVSDGCIKIIECENVEFKRTFNVIYHKNKYMTSATKDFMEMVKENVQDSDY